MGPKLFTFIQIVVGIWFYRYVDNISDYQHKKRYFHLRRYNIIINFLYLTNKKWWERVVYLYVEIKSLLKSIMMT